MLEPACDRLNDGEARCLPLEILLCLNHRIVATFWIVQLSGTVPLAFRKPRLLFIVEAAGEGDRNTRQHGQGDS